MRLVKTNDNSYTFFNEEYEETYHSTSGALEEAKRKYVEPLEIEEGDIILDICFGLGYNTFAAMQSKKKLKVVALESDERILEALEEIELEDLFLIIKALAKNKEYNSKDYNLKLIVGDARKTIKELDTEFNKVFLDPFSPKKNPELWTTEFFKNIFNIMLPGAKLATYSCAGQVRRNLKEAGFEVKDGPCIGRRSPSTIAIKLSY